MSETTIHQDTSPVQFLDKYLHPEPTPYDSPEASYRELRHRVITALGQPKLIDEFIDEVDAEPDVFTKLATSRAWAGWIVMRATMRENGRDRYRCAYCGKRECSH